MKKLLEKLPFYNQAVLPYHYGQAVIAGIKNGFPGRRLRVIAVTGTNGKTTTCFMLWNMLNKAGYKTGLMTTVAYGINKLKPELGHMTTVDAFTLNRRIKEIADQGAEFLVLEVTSHALAEFRILNIPVEIAIFTNLTHEHLDYHKTIERYRAAKGKLFKKAKFSILNADDPATKYYTKIAKKYSSYGIKHGQNKPTDIQLKVNGVEYSYHNMHIKTQIPGEFNVYNSLAAVIAGERLHLTKRQIEQGIASLPSVEGRMNIIDEGQPFTVIVDYAHAPDAIAKVFDSVASHKGRVISVHGGAGRRDPSTRPIRGRQLAEHSDIVIITEDDSRDEPVDKIMQGFIDGATEAGKTLGKDLLAIPDRRTAIKKALSLAHKGDLVLILGKGHEKSILRADGPHDFSDLEETKKLLKQK